MLSFQAIGHLALGQFKEATAVAQPKIAPAVFFDAPRKIFARAAHFAEFPFSAPRAAPSLSRFFEEVRPLKKAQHWIDLSSVAVTVPYVTKEFFSVPATSRKPADWQSLPVASPASVFSGVSFDAFLRGLTARRREPEWWTTALRKINFTDITDTNVLQLPINAVLAGQQDYEVSKREWEVKNPNYKITVTVSSDGVKNLGGKSSFTVKTDNRGYD